MPNALHRAPLLAGLLLPATLLAQAVPERTPRPLSRDGMVEHEETFSRIKSVMALPDGRVVVPDATEKKLMLLDFATQRAVQLARSGSGPKEYQTPGGVYRSRQGGVVVYDQQQRRFLPILANGTVGDAIALPFSPTSVSVNDRGPDQFVPDTLGNVLSQVTSRGAGAIETRLVRYNSRGTEHEVAELTSAASRELPGSDARVVMRQLVRFSPADVWAVAPDGWTVVLSAAPYQARWIPPSGNAVQGAVLPFTALPVTKADRDAAKAASSNRPPATVSIGGSGGERISPIRPPNTEPLFADTKPAFPVHVPSFDPLGRVWVERHVVQGAPLVYDVIDRRGAVVDRIQFPARTRLAGFGTGVLYVVHTDEDDLLHVQRYRMP